MDESLTLIEIIALLSGCLVLSFFVVGVAGGLRFMKDSYMDRKHRGADSASPGRNGPA